MFSNARTIVKVFGLDIRIDPSWLLIAALITWSLWLHVFPQATPGQTQQTYGVMAVIAMLLFFASLLLHELAHALTGRRFGVQTRQITLFLFGGVAELEQEPSHALDEFWIAIAGPAMSFLLSGSFWVLTGAASFLGIGDPIIEVLRYLALINLILAVFNLLPAFPLDGGRVLRAWLWHRNGDVLLATEAAARSGTLIAYGLMAMGVMSLVQGAFVGGLWLILLALFVLAAARGSVESQRVKSLLGHKTVANLLTSKPIVATPQMTLSELVNQVMLHNRVSFVPVLENGVLLGHIDTTVLSGIDRENWANTHVGDVFVGLAESTTIPSTMQVTDLFDQIATTGQRKFMVVDDRKLAGVVTTADLTRYLALVHDFGRQISHPNMRVSRQ
ncbi:MAG: site-2 protease family protein [Arenibacterium sp.]